MILLYPKKVYSGFFILVYLEQTFWNKNNKFINITNLFSVKGKKYSDFCLQLRIIWNKLHDLEEKYQWCIIDKIDLSFKYYIPVLVLK